MSRRDKLVILRRADIFIVGHGPRRTRTVGKGERAYFFCDLGHDELGNPVSMIELGNGELAVAPLDLFRVCPSQAVT